MYYSLLPNEFDFLFFIVAALVQEAAENCLWKINVLCHLNSIHSATITVYICYCWSTSLERPANRTPQHWTDNQNFLQTFENCTVFYFMRPRRICDSLILCSICKCLYLLTYLLTMLIVHSLCFNCHFPR